MAEEHQTSSATGSRNNDAPALGQPGGDAAHERHLAIRPSFCPGCAYPLGDDVRSLAIEFWEEDRPLYQMRCASCGWTGEISPAADRQRDG
jgi:hypothetical protein